MVWNFFGVSFGLNLLEESSLVKKITARSSCMLTRMGVLCREVYFHVVYSLLGTMAKKNRRLFDGKKRSSCRVIEDVKTLLWSWGLLCKDGRKFMLDTIIFSWEQSIKM